ncbi:MAG: RdgB/HAM1 family non-canonical purine NTP pyrophosphatase [Raoultibacter sp.]
MKHVVIASNNAHKVEEIKTALDFEGWDFCTLREVGVVSEPEEDADTFEGNARIKARAAREATGYASLADDSGLVIDALRGAPGVYSARYAGIHGNDDDNNAKVLAELAGISLEKRTARFVCALVFIDEDGSETTAQGTIEGRIGYAPRGSEGFGYDPLFFPNEFDGAKSLSEVSQEEKNVISHRGNALRELKKKISPIW